jgi:hypothetical protein
MSLAFAEPRILVEKLLDDPRCMITGALGLAARVTALPRLELPGL